MSIIIFWLLCMCCAYGNLPPYTSPGSWMSAMSGVGNFNSSTTTLFMALWDGSTGQNYTTVIGVNKTFSSFIPTTNESVIAIAFNQIEIYNATYVALYKYGPRQAPILAAPPCLMPVYASEVFPFFFHGEIYALSGYILYSIGTSSMQDSVCQLTVLQPLPISYSPFCSLSMTADRLAYISGTSLVELWYKDKGTFTITHQSIPEALSGTWLWLQEDPVTSDYYFYSTTIDYTSNFWQGKHDDASNVTWSKMEFWNHLDPGQFTIDSRNETDFGGPLFCDVDSFYFTYCWTVQGQAAWKGPRLKDAFDGDSGGISTQFYDPYCH